MALIDIHAITPSAALVVFVFGFVMGLGWTLAAWLLGKILR